MIKLRKIKLQTRFFLSYLSMTLLVVTAFSFFFYKYTSNILIERETKAATDLNATFLKQTEDALTDMDTVSINIGYSNLIKDRLRQSNDLTMGSNDFQALADLFVTINGADLKVDQINLYDFSGSMVQVGIKNSSRKFDLDSLEWLEEVKQLGGKKLISPTYSTTAFSSSTNTAKTSVWYLSLYRTFFDRYKKEVGVIETVKRCNSVFKSIISYQQKNKNNPHQVYVYQEDGTLLYPYGLTKEEERIIPDYMHAISGVDTRTAYRNATSGEKELLVSQSSSYTNWTYITVQPEAKILQPVHNLIQLLIGVAAIMLLFAIFLSWLLSRGLIKPIHKLQRIIHQTELDSLGDSQVRTLDTSFDELEELNQAFLHMSSNLKTSMNELIDSRQQELKSRSLALQSQMNPHFYYNTLAGIIVLAENKQNEEVAAMCRKLTRIMRYITNANSPLVFMKEELTYIEEYLYCMKVRYQTSLNYTISIDDAIMNLTIPRLIIQPLVENAIKYGTNCEPPWSISILGSRQEHGWQIEVIDSGTGFTEEALALIHSRIEDAEAKPGIPEIQINGMGILNVYLRWKLYCGDDFIFTCDNTPEGHGRVTIGRKMSLEEEE